MSHTHKQPEASGAVLVSVDGTLPSAADSHVRVPENPAEWRRREQAGARYTLSVVSSEEGAE